MLAAKITPSVAHSRHCAPNHIDQPGEECFLTNAIERAHERLSALQSAIEACFLDHPNESDTRLKVLDRILFEVLNWQHEAVFTEPHTDSGYID